MTKFDWQTEEENVWEDETAVAAASQPVPGRFPWRFFLAVVVILVAAGFLVYRQVDQRLEATSAEIKADVLSSHNLVLQAARQRDHELFLSLLSGRDGRWTEAQEQLLVQGLLFDRAPFGLQQAAAGPGALAENGNRVELSPDFGTAEVTFEEQYLVQADSGVTETVRLQQTAVYRRGSERWLLSPPDGEFWGNWITDESESLTLVYRQRDEAVARRLASELEAMLAQMCTLPDLNCPDDLHVILRLDDGAPALLAIMTEYLPAPAQRLDRSLNLSLPSPTLVGVPVEEAGYQALLQAYRAWLVAAVVPDLVGWTCCVHAGFFRGLLDYQLSQLGLRPWPVTGDDYARVLSESVRLYDLGGLWSAGDAAILTGKEGWKILTLIDFLMQHSPVSAAAMQRELRGALLLNWLNGLVEVEAAPEDNRPLSEQLDRAWWAHAYTQVLAAQPPPPIPLPEQDILLACVRQREMEETVLYRYQFDTGLWTQALVSQGYGFMSPLPGDEALVLHTISFEQERSQTQIWRPDGETVILANDTLLLSIGQTDPSGRYLVAYPLDQDEPSLTILRLIDMHECQGGRCNTWSSMGPMWSPAGRQTLLSQGQSFFLNVLTVDGKMFLSDPRTTPGRPLLLYRGDERGQLEPGSDELMPVGAGFAPFWLDDETYGYVRPVGAALRTPEQAVEGWLTAGSRATTDFEIVTASVHDDEPHPLLARQDLMDLLAAEAEMTAVTISFITRHPIDPDLLFIVAFSMVRDQTYVFRFDLLSGELSLRLPAKEGFRLDQVNSLGFSPDGRWLTLLGMTGGPSPQALITLYDVYRDEAKALPAQIPSFLPATAYDWSGEWLLYAVNENVLHLVAPDHDYQRVIAHNFATCTALAWISP